MSSELLRQAAALIRQRAQAATPSPWRVGTGYGGVVSTAAIAASDPRSEPELLAAYGGYLIGESLTVADRAHVASWDPAVALAVADWLDDTALCVERAESVLQYDGSALAVARAYLGVDDE